MVQLPSGMDFVLETAQTKNFGAGVRRHEFDRDVTAYLKILGSIHLPHPALADGGDDPVPAHRHATR
jgi:hypothetical protein